MKKLISVVIPIYNEEAVLSKFLEKELMPALNNLEEKVELVLVDDGSSDKTLEVIRDFSKKNSGLTVRVVALMRNFGKESALTAGIQQARGDAVIIIDADGQHPASEIPRMVERWHAGAKVVTAIRGQNTTDHKFASKLYYKFMRMAGNKNIIEGELDFRLMDRVVVDEFNKFTEHNRLTRGLIDWLGFPQEFIKVSTKARAGGKPTYETKKLRALAGDSLVSASRTPLVVFGYIGVFIMLLALGPGLFQLVQEYILGDPMGLQWGGGVAVSLLVAFLVGLVLVSQAITAMYISQIHAESKNRPLFVIDKSKSTDLKDEK